MSLGVENSSYRLRSVFPLPEDLLSDSSIAERITQVLQKGAEINIGQKNFSAVDSDWVIITKKSDLSAEMPCLDQLQERDITVCQEIDVPEGVLTTSSSIEEGYEGYIFVDIDRIVEMSIAANNVLSRISKEPFAFSDTIKKIITLDAQTLLKNVMMPIKSLSSISVDSRSITLDSPIDLLKETQIEERLPEDVNVAEIVEKIAMWKNAYNYLNRLYEFKINSLVYNLYPNGTVLEGEHGEFCSTVDTIGINMEIGISPSGEDFSEDRAIWTLAGIIKVVGENSLESDMRLHMH